MSDPIQALWIVLAFARDCVALITIVVCMAEYMAGRAITGTIRGGLVQSVSWPIRRIRDALDAQSKAEDERYVDPTRVD